MQLRLLFHVASIFPGSVLIQKVNWQFYKTNHKMEGLSSEFRILRAVTFLVLSQTRSVRVERHLLVIDLSRLATLRRRWKNNIKMEFHEMAGRVRGVN